MQTAPSQVRAGDHTGGVGSSCPVLFHAGKTPGFGWAARCGFQNFLRRYAPRRYNPERGEACTQNKPACALRTSKKKTPSSGGIHLTWRTPLKATSSVPTSKRTLVFGVRISVIVLKGGLINFNRPSLVKMSLKYNGILTKVKVEVDDPALL